MNEQTEDSVVYEQQGSGQVWSPDLYDSHHRYVSRYGKELVELLKPMPEEMVLDIGCGTADLSHLITLEGAYVVGIDSNQQMLISGREKFPDLDLRCMKAEEMVFDQEFDAVFSNAVFHWIEHLDLVAAGMFRALKPGGRFVLEFGGEHCCESIYSTLEEEIRRAGFEPVRVHYFRSAEQVSEILTAAGLTVDSTLFYPRDTLLTGRNGLLNYLKMFCLGMMENVPETEREIIIGATVTSLAPKLQRDGVWHADYTRLRITGHKA